MSTTVTMLQPAAAAPAAAASAAPSAAPPLPPAAADGNPLLQPWEGPHGGFPAFAAYRPEHFLPALRAAAAAHLAEAAAIASAAAPATFENTTRALDRSGAALSRVQRVLQHLCASATSPALQAVELEAAPLMAAHASALYMGVPGLFDRVAAVHAARASLPPQEARLAERQHLDFERAGARLFAGAQARYAEVTAALATLHTEFAQNVLKDEAECTLRVGAEELAGCPPDVVAAAASAAAARGGAPGELLLTLSRSQVEPVLTYAHSRALRERLWRQWTLRGQLTPARDNRALIKRILLLRSEQAALHGYPSFGAYQTADTMAQTPGRVMELLENVWPRARASAERERAGLEAFAAAAGSGSEGGVQPWDWRFWAERERAAVYDFDEAALKPYLSLDAVTGALFDTAQRLFGLRFVRTAQPLYHADVVVYEVHQGAEGEGGELLGFFCADNFARPDKQGGAWMSELRTAHRDGERALPIICNNNNFSRAPEGQPTLLTYDDAVTAFHEFGHGLHGLLSEATYAGLAGTAVLKDFVELPSQLFEHWLGQPEVLRRHAKHVATGEALPEALLAKLKAAQRYGLGFATAEYASCALLDQALHALPREELEALDIERYEQATLARLGMPQGIILRHRPSHFSHLFSDSAYAACYFVYVWAETLDADVFEAFLETGDCFDAATAARARRCIYAAGNSKEPGELFREFRGREPRIEAMLKKKGLLE